MKKNILLVSIIILSGIVFAGCTKKPNQEMVEPSPEAMELGKDTSDLSPDDSQALEEMEQPVSESTNLEDIEAELDGTTILEEDLGEL